MNENFSEIINSNKLVLVDFSAEWCGPCRMLGPVLEQLKNRVGDKVRIIKIDVDKNPELAYKYNVRSVPTLILFRNGLILWSGVGVKTADYLENVVNNYGSVVTQ